MKKQLIKEYVELLIEDSGGDYGGLPGMGGGAAHYTDSQGLKKIFIDPFLDVFKVAKGKALELHQRTFALARVVFETVMTTLIPWKEDDYDAIFEEERRELDSIRSKYADVYQATWDTFKQNDFAVCAFMYSPQVFLTEKFISKAPKQALNLLSTLTNGRIDGWLGKVKDKFESMRYGGGNNKKKRKSTHQVFRDRLVKVLGGGEDAQQESFIREDEEKKNTEQDPVKWLARVLTTDKVLAKVESSSKVKEMKSTGKGLANKTLKSVFEQAKTTLSAKSFEELQKTSKKKLPGIEKLEKVDPKEREAAEKKILQTVHASLKKMYVKKLEDQVKEAVKIGVPKEHPLVQLYAKVISKISAM